MAEGRLGSLPRLEEGRPTVVVPHNALQGEQAAEGTKTRWPVRWPEMWTRW